MASLGARAVENDLRTIGSLLRSPSAAGRGRTHGMLCVPVCGRFVEAEHDRQHAILSLYTRAPSEKWLTELSGPGEAMVAEEAAPLLEWGRARMGGGGLAQHPCQAQPEFLQH